MIANIKDRAESITETRNFIPELFGSKKKQSILRYAFPTGPKGTEQFNDFKKVIELEKAKVATRNRVLTGSQTARNERELLESGANVSPAVDVMSRIAAMDAPGIAAQAIKGVGARIGGMTPESANLIAAKLFTSSPTEQQAILNRLQGTEKRLVEDALKRISRQQTTSALLGGQAGSLISQ
jgi:hypothetical protein